MSINAGRINTNVNTPVNISQRKQKNNLKEIKTA